MSVALIIGTAKGAMIGRADDARRTWALSAMEFPGWNVTAATRDHEGRFYVGLMGDVYGVVVMVSDDLESWRAVDAPPRFAPGDPGNAEHKRIVRSTDVLGHYGDADRHVDQIWRLHAAGERIYAGVSEAGLFRSEDRGETWQPVPGFNDHETRAGWLAGFGGLGAHAVLADPQDADRLWVGVSAAGVFRSDDGGRSFAFKNEGVQRGEGVCVHGLAADPGDAALIYRQDHRGMYRTRDGGDHWESIETGLPVGELADGHRCTFGFAVAVDPGSRAAFCIPLQGDNFRYPPEGRLRVYRSEDEGDHWHPLRDGLPDGCYANVLRGAIAVDGADPGGVYFGTTVGQVFASPDRGEHWAALPVTLPKVLSVNAFIL